MGRMRRGLKLSRTARRYTRTGGLFKWKNIEDAETAGGPRANVKTGHVLEIQNTGGTWWTTTSNCLGAPGAVTSSVTATAAPERNNSIGQSA